MPVAWWKQDPRMMDAGKRGKHLERLRGELERQHKRRAMAESKYHELVGTLRNYDRNKARESHDKAAAKIRQIMFAISNIINMQENDNGILPELDGSRAVSE